MGVTSADIKKLREKTGISVMQCKKALDEACGDMEKAVIILKKKGGEAAGKRSDRALKSGAIGSYVHNTYEVASLVALSCETDFVAKNEEFIALARDIAMHVTAAAPLYLKREEIGESEIVKAKEVFDKEIVGKSKDMREKILAGKLDAYFKEQVLLEQTYIKDADRTIKDLVNEGIQKFGENIAVQSFSRLSVK